MDENKTHEGNMTESDVMQQSNAPTLSNVETSQSGSNGTMNQPAAESAEQAQKTYAQSAAPSRDTWQQPYTGTQPQNPYQTPGAYQHPNYYRPQPYPPQYYNRNHPSRGKATASLVLGIISLVFFWMSFLAVISVVCSIIGIVLGNSARKELGPEQGQGQATAGLACSIIGLVLSVIMIVVFTLIMVAAFSYLPEYGGIHM